MYRVSPFSYLVGGMLATGVANVEVTCSSIEVLRVDPAFGNCGEYFAQYVGFAGGKVLNPAATSACEFCSVADTNVFLGAVGIHVRYTHSSNNLCPINLIFS
jgi:ABC-type multidrug transport system permease subunit